MTPYGASYRPVWGFLLPCSLIATYECEQALADVVCGLTESLRDDDERRNARREHRLRGRFPCMKVAQSTWASVTRWNGPHMSFCSAAIREKGKEQMFDQGPRLPNRPRRPAYVGIPAANERYLHERYKADSDSKLTAAPKEANASTVRERVMNVLFPFKGVGPLGAVIGHRATNVLDHMNASERRSSVSLSDQFWVGNDWRNMMIDCGVQGQLKNQLRTTLSQSG